MSAQKAPLSTRFLRLARMAAWLFRTGRDLRSIDGRNDEQRNRALTTLGSGALQALGIKLDVAAPPSHRSVNGTLVVSNHVSWLDIFAMSALYPSSFIAKQEIRDWPVLGKMGKNAGTVFINRNARKDVGRTNAAISTALQQGMNVSFFPEAKTSLGIDVLPFKAALFQAAIDSSAPIQAISLRYYDHTGQRTTEPSYAGSMNLFKSLWRIVSMPEIHIRIDFAEPLVPAEHPQKDRYGLKDIAEQFVRTKVMEDSPLNKGYPSEDSGIQPAAHS
ncbi:1-acylglycerol-3-phosphate O-acyltransferase [Uruburuella testudinis]|uniref:1-acyl-sn-glycerol-3-phosphate acyltransferase n=1 Tax=Uruburuella testudinis TaxID=1282863 RepID=A0ABY4DVF2_9NEIS|nr:1-acylglycerol-3-phosphate O-acyltransferase [Uruburuella testudinis]UOO82597.1 1-acylglycerol-3-phosphate O-acyltransferase [Uruburuella testudinis]